MERLTKFGGHLKSHWHGKKLAAGWNVCHKTHRQIGGFTTICIFEGVVCEHACAKTKKHMHTCTHGNCARTHTRTQVHQITAIIACTVACNCRCRKKTHHEKKTSVLRAGDISVGCLPFRSAELTPSTLLFGARTSMLLCPGDQELRLVFGGFA